MTTEESNTNETPAAEATEEEMLPQDDADQHENGRDTTAGVGAGVRAVRENKKRGARRQDKTSEVPIEQLYDLSKPIKRVRCPNLCTISYTSMISF